MGDWITYISPHEGWTREKRGTRYVHKRTGAVLAWEYGHTSLGLGHSWYLYVGSRKIKDFNRGPYTLFEAAERAIRRAAIDAI